MDPTARTGGSFPPMWQRPAKSRRRRSVISLTPLIDVVFILLIFFMLATVLERWNAITLDSPARAIAGSSMEGAILIEVWPEGLRVGGTAITPATLVSQIRDRLRTKPDQRYLVRPEPRVPLQSTVAVLDRVTGAGARHVSMIRR